MLFEATKFTVPTRIALHKNVLTMMMVVARSIREDEAHLLCYQRPHLCTILIAGVYEINLKLQEILILWDVETDDEK